MEYLSAQQMSKKWSISARRIQILCNQSRIPGAYKIGYTWAIPFDAQKPVDARIKSGKFCKEKSTLEEV